MAKTLKFNLKIDKDIQVRTLEDLRNNFVLEDILEYYKSKKLHKWLRVRGFAEELKKVNKITSRWEEEILNSLIQIFGVETNPSAIEYSLDLLEYERHRVLVKKEKDKAISDTNTLFSKYFERYDGLIEDIINNPENRPLIQAAIQTIENEYQELFKHDFRNFFSRVKAKSTLAIICLLMNPFTRQFFIKDESSLSENIDTPLLHVEIKALLTTSALEACPDVIKETKLTENRFVELTTKKCLVLKLYNSSSTCAVAERDHNKDYLTSVVICNKFPIWEGLEFQNSDTSNKNAVYYIEI